MVYDKLIFGFVGIIGFRKIDIEDCDVVVEVVVLCGKVKYELIFFDLWGDFQFYINLGFEISGWDVDLKIVIQVNVKGMLGVLCDMQVKVKVVGYMLVFFMSIGGWSMSNGFYEIVVFDFFCKIFVKGVVKLFKQFLMFSEVDIDWEYLNDEGVGNLFGVEDGVNYVLLIVELC